MGAGEELLRTLHHSLVRKSGQAVHNRHQSSLYLYWLGLLMIHRLGYFTDFCSLFEYVHYCCSCSLLLYRMRKRK